MAATSTQDQNLPGTMPRRSIKKLALQQFSVLPLLITSVVLVARMFHVLHRYAVNLFFWDEWDFRAPQFQGAPLWRIFTWEHSPHRQGIGFVVDTLVGHFTHLDSRMESIFLGIVTVMAMVCAIWLKRRLFGPISAWDAVIPAIFLVPSQFLSFVAAPNPSHGSFPLLLTILYGLAWVQKNIILRYSSILILNFFLIYTGFGFFMGLLTPLLFSADLYHALAARRHWHWSLPLMSLVISVLSLASFFIGYKFSPAADCFHFPYSHPLHYVWFSGLIFSSFFSLSGHSMFVSMIGLAFLLVTGLVCGTSSYQLLFDRGSWARNIAVLSLTALSLLFCMNAAVGRICLGLDTAHASRYVPYLVPGFLGLYFYVLSWEPGRARSFLFAGFVFVIFAGSTTLRQADKLTLRGLQENKQRWKDCYLRTRNVDGCDESVGFLIYPNPAATHLVEKLEFLRAHKLNLYDGK